MGIRERIIYGIWMLVIFLGATGNRFITKQVTLGEYYLVCVGIGIWITLLNMFDDEE
jgi:hypothetical protein